MKCLQTVVNELEDIVDSELMARKSSTSSISKSEAIDAFLIIGKLTGKSPTEFAKRIKPRDLEQLLKEKEDISISTNRVEGLHPKYSRLLAFNKAEEPMRITVSTVKWWLICSLLLRKRGHRP